MLQKMVSNSGVPKYSGLIINNNYNGLMILLCLNSSDFETTKISRITVVATPKLIALRVVSIYNDSHGFVHFRILPIVFGQIIDENGGNTVYI